MYIVYAANSGNCKFNQLFNFFEVTSFNCLNRSTSLILNPNNDTCYLDLTGILETKKKIFLEWFSFICTCTYHLHLPLRSSAGVLRLKVQAQVVASPSQVHHSLPCRLRPCRKGERSPEVLHYNRYVACS